MPQIQPKEVLVLPAEDSSTELVPPADPRADIVSIDPERRGGAPCFAGTRVPLQDLWGYLAEGESLDTFLDSFPTVTREQAVKAIRMAAERLLEGLPAR